MTYKKCKSALQLAIVSSEKALSQEKRVAYIQRLEAS